MADAKIITYGELISATVDVVPDNQEDALLIISNDGNELFSISTNETDDESVRMVQPQIYDRGDNLTDSPRALIDAQGGRTNIDTIGAGNEIVFRPNQVEKFRINVDGTITTGGEDTSLAAAGGLHLKIADSTLAAPSGDYDDLVIEGSGNTGLTFSTTGNSGIRFQKDNDNAYGAGGDHGLRFVAASKTLQSWLSGISRLSIAGNGEVKWNYVGVQYFSGNGADDANSEPLYLADSGATLVINARKGNYGDVTLTANVTAIKFLYHPNDGSVFTMTTKITQHGSSAKTIDYSDSAVTVYAGDGTGAASTGEMKWSGGVHHTMSTGTGDVDIVQFTIFPNGATFDVFAAVIGQDFS